MLSFLLILLGLSPFVTIFVARKAGKSIRWKILIIVALPSVFLEYIHWFTDYYFAWQYTDIIGHLLSMIMIVFSIYLLVTNKKLRSSLLIISTLLVLLFTAALFGESIIRAAYGSESRIKANWKIKQYEIRKIDVQGWAGSAYTIHTLRRYTFGGFIYAKLGQGSIEEDGCQIKFSRISEPTYTFNLCEKTLINKEDP